VNVQVGRFVADFVWPEQKVVVETDGYRYHRGRAAFEADRSRDLELRAMGFEVIRLTHRQVVEKPNDSIKALRVALRS
jgi:very-short-patch-repair endonuclease